MTNGRLIWAIVIAIGCLAGCKKDPLSSDEGSSSTPYVPSFSPVTVNHTTINIGAIPANALDSARARLKIAYGHTSHGSQLIDGMTGLVTFKGQAYRFNSAGSGGALLLRDNPFSGASDLGNPDLTTWAGATRTYLNVHPEVNVVLWSWCGQVSSASEADISNYLNLMNTLERDFPGVRFVYMTGHLDGSGLAGNLHKRNDQIRTYCTAYNKTLYDFEDIESYNPDGAYFGAKNPNDACDYDSDANGSLDKNWATDWQTAHAGQWYQCGAAHTQPVNANMKAYAAWWLWARLAGWPGN
jgi:hypothetical protein